MSFLELLSELKKIISDTLDKFNLSILFDSLFEYKSNNVEKKMDWTL